MKWPNFRAVVDFWSKAPKKERLFSSFSFLLFIEALDIREELGWEVWETGIIWMELRQCCSHQWNIHSVTFEPEIFHLLITYLTIFKRYFTYLVGTSPIETSTIFNKPKIFNPSTASNDSQFFLDCKFD